MRKTVFIILSFLILGSAVNAQHRTAKRKSPKNNIPATTQASAKATNGTIETITVNGVSFNMIFVEGGTFTMGASGKLGDIEILKDLAPAHKVTLSSFNIGQTEVKKELWLAVMGENPSWFNSNGNEKYNSTHSENYGTNLKRPVESVSWDDCQNFIRKLNEKTGKQFRLPTEAEWEYAARGGNKSNSYSFSGSNTINEIGWYDDHSGNLITHEVCGKLPNELGIYDMTGNVYEWCQDWYDENYYTISPSTNPKGPSSGSYRTCRGGSCSLFCSDFYCYIPYRSYSSPTSRLKSQGFRLAM